MMPNGRRQNAPITSAGGLFGQKPVKFVSHARAQYAIRAI
jgi:hypothetical protein